MTTKPPRASRRKRKKKSTDARRAAIAYLGLGSNVGDRRAFLDAALRAIGARARLLAVSSFYRTDPVGHVAQRPFYNAVASVAWRGSAAALLALLQRIERDLGRTATFRNGPREIDLDLLDFGGRVGGQSGPVLPHPRMAARRFVLAPLSEIAAGWRHPVTGESARELMAKLPARPAARRLPPTAVSASRRRGFAARPAGSAAPRRGNPPRATPPRPPARSGSPRPAPRSTRRRALRRERAD